MINLSSNRFISSYLPWHFLRNHRDCVPRIQDIRLQRLRLLLCSLLQVICNMFLVQKVMRNTKQNTHHLMLGVADVQIRPLQQLFVSDPFCRVSNGHMAKICHISQRSGKFSSQFRKTGVSRQWSPEIILKSDVLNSPACRVLKCLKHGETPLSGRIFVGWRTSNPPAIVVSTAR